MQVFGAMFLALILALGCGVKRKQSAPPPEAKADKGDEKPSDSNPFGNLDFLGSMLSQQLDQPGPYDEPKASDGFDKDTPHFGVIELSGPIVELQAFSMFAAPGGLELRKAIDKLAKLSASDKVLGLVLRVGEVSINMAAAEELRSAMLQFKGDSQRKLLCHVESVSNVTYYLLSACDSIGVAPTGGLVVSGVAATPVHIKGMLDKLGIRPDFVNIGAYKGAADPITRDSPSKEQQETMQAIIDGMYDTMVDGIAQGRSLERTVVEGLIDKAMFLPEEAVAAKLADRVAVFESYRAEALAGAPWHHVSLGEKQGPPDMTELMKFVGLMPRPLPSEDHVALVYALGMIIDGKGEGILGARNEIASRPLAAALRRLAANDSVKAVVLRVDSGGGSALASELILTALDEIKKQGKPVIVSMGGVAASGGYYISSHADKVFASDNTITGSIGVLGGKLVIREALDSMGIKMFPMARGKRAQMYSMVDAWTEDERNAVKQNMEAIYKTFVTHVSTGRNKSYDDVHAIAQGRVWTGKAAKEHGLVDEIGGLHAALTEARKLGKVADDADVEVYPPQPTLLDIVGSFGGPQASLGLGITLDTRALAMLDEIAQITSLSEARTIAQTLKTLSMLRDNHVLAAAFLPIASP